MEDAEARRQLQTLSNQPNASMEAHARILLALKEEEGFDPRVIYDVGASVLHWTRMVSGIWPGARTIVFDANPDLQELYRACGLPDYHLGVLGHSDEQLVQFWYSRELPYGNSYYRQSNGTPGAPAYDRFLELPTRTLDSIVQEREWPGPDLVKIDVQGAERDILEGGLDTLRQTEYLIVEMQHEPFNNGAPMVETTLPWLRSLGWELLKPRFSDNGPDADYLFRKQRSGS